MKTYQLLVCALLPFLMVNCSSDTNAPEEEDLNGVREELLISAQSVTTEVIETRASSAFVTGTSFSLYVQDGSESSYFSDTKTSTATAKDADGANKNELTLSPPLYWDVLGGKLAKLNIYGVYPTTASVSGDDVSWIITDNITTSDLMRAANIGFEYTKTDAAHLDFKHVLSKVSITIEAGDGFKETDFAGAVVKFNVKTGGAYNYVNDNCPSPTGGDITPTLSNGSYTTLSFPFTETTSYKLATITLGSNVYPVTVSSLDFDAGYHYTYTVTVNKSGVSLTASITDWADGGGGAPSTKLVEPGDFSIADTDKTELTDESTITVNITDGNNKPHTTMFTYAKSGETWTPSTPLYWDDMKLPLKQVDALLKLGGNSGGDDLFVATKKNVAIGEVLALGTFKRPLSKITITVETSTGVGVTDNVNLAEIQSVAIPGHFLHTINADGVTVEESSDALSTVENKGTAGTYIYELFMLPATLETLCEITIEEDTNNTNVYSVSLGTGKEFEAGKHYTYTVTITKTKVNFTGSLVDWIIQEEDGIKTGL